MALAGCLQSQQCRCPLSTRRCWTPVSSANPGKASCSMQTSARSSGGASHRTCSPQQRQHAAAAAAAPARRAARRQMFVVNAASNRSVIEEGGHTVSTPWVPPRPISACHGRVSAAGLHARSASCFILLAFCSCGHDEGREAGPGVSGGRGVPADAGHRQPDGADAGRCAASPLCCKSLTILALVSSAEVVAD